MVGDIELRGRLPGSTRLATGLPSRVGRKEKSVSSLFKRKPSTITREPKAFSIDRVIDTALPSRSITARSLVEGSSGEASSPRAAWRRAGRRRLARTALDQRPRGDRSRRQCGVDDPVDRKRLRLAGDG